MTLRATLGFASVMLLLFSLLAVWRVPTVPGWKLALVATEFGHWVALVPAGLALVSWFALGGGPRVCVLLLNTAAVAMLLSPAVRAVAVARKADLAWTSSGLAAFAVTDSERGIRWGALWQGADDSLPVGETHIFVRRDGVELALDFFRPPASRATPAPCVVVVHGGGWDSGERTQLPAMNSALVANGFAVASVDYRLAPRWRWPAPRDDVTAALHWLRDHAGDLGIAPDNFVLLGRSAGGQIALATAYRLGRSEVRGVISLYGPADLHFAYVHGTENDTLRSPALLRAYLGGAPDVERAVYDDASPYFEVSANVPPTLLLHGAGDTLVWHRQSERLADKLSATGAPHLFISLPWATHAFDYNLNGPGGQITRAAVLRFLRAVARTPENKSGGR